MASAKRPEKHFSKKYTEAKGPDGSSSLTVGGMTKAMTSIKHVYFACKATPYLCNQSENIKKLTGGIQLYLEKSEPDKRLPDFVKDKIEITLEADDETDLKGMASAFEHLEDYALRLAWYPWKKQIKKIKVHNAYVKMHVEPYLQGTKEIFRRLGYQKSRTTNDELLIERMPERDTILQVAFDCYIAQKEVEIYVMIFDKLKNDGFSAKDVHICRTKCRGTDKDAITWIWDNCEPQRKKLFSHHSLDSGTQRSSSKGEDLVFHSLTPQPTKGTHTKALDKEKAARLQMYEEEARKAPVVPPRGSSVTSDVLKDPQIPYIDGQKSNNFNEGTLEEHVSESLRIVEKSNSLTSPEIRRPPAGEEWKEVYKTVENLGERYYDPGGRGDILKGQEMIPRDDEDYYGPDQEVTMKRGDPLKPVMSTQSQSFSPSPYSAARYGGDLMKSVTSGYNSKADRPQLSSLMGTNTDLYSSAKSSGYTSHPDKTSIPRVNLMQQSDLYSSGSGKTSAVQSSNRVCTNQDSVRSYSRNISVDGADSVKIQQDPHDTSIHIVTNTSKEPKHEFTTFRGNEARQPAVTRTQYDIAGRQTDDPDYVQLKQVNPKGKPSFEKNFQATTQRLYQASSNTSLTRQPSVDSGVRSVATSNREESQVSRQKSVEKWQCESCTYLNDLSAKSCIMCSKSRQKGSESDPLSIGGYQCRKCTFVNKPGARICTTCGAFLKNSPTFV